MSDLIGRVMLLPVCCCSRGQPSRLCRAAQRAPEWALSRVFAWTIFAAHQPRPFPLGRLPKISVLPFTFARARFLPPGALRLKVDRVRSAILRRNNDPTVGRPFGRVSNQPLIQSADPNFMRLNEPIT